MLVVAFLIIALQQQPPKVAFEAPAGSLYAAVNPDGRTVLPNGRFLTPKGRRLYGMENVWQCALSPNGKTLVLFHDDGLTIYDNYLSEPAQRRFVKLSVAPAGAFTRDGQNLIVSTGEAGGIQLLRAPEFTDGPTIVANSEQVRDSFINDLVLSKDETLVYGVDVANQDLVVFDLRAIRVVKRLKAGRQPYAIAADEQKRKLYVANIGLFDYSLIPAPREGEGDKRGLSKPPFAFPSKESERGVEMEGRFVPGIGDPRVPDAQSVFLYDASSPASPKLIKSVKSGVLIHAPADGGKAVGGSAPNALLVSRGRLYVSNANNDTVQVFDANSLKPLKTVKLAPVKELAKLRGVIPSGMALSPAGDRLYVCESGLNAVAVVNTATYEVVGHIPSGWFPVQVKPSQDGKTLLVATQKGVGRGPRGYLNRRAESDERYGLPDMPGMVQAVPAPDPVTLKSWTKEVLANNGLRNAYQENKAKAKTPIPYLYGVPSDKIKYVVFITKENHTFDGIFGDLKGAKGQPEYAEFGMNGWIAEKGKSERLPIMINHHRLAQQFAISDNFYMEPQASGDGHRWLVGVYPSLWTTRVFYSGWDFKLNNDAKGRLVSMGSNGSPIPEDYLENGSMWEHLARGGIPFRNYGEGFEFPGSLEPSDPGETGTILTVNHPMSKALWDNTCWSYPMYNNDIPDVARAEWFIEDLEKNYRRKGKPIPRFMNITLCNDHGARPKPDEGYPYVCSYMADNDQALGRVVEYLTGLPEWKQMAIFVTQDDPGGDADHVDRHRSFVLAISPYAKRGYVSNVHTSIMSCIKSIYKIFGLVPNNMFDALATDLADMFTDKPDFTPYRMVEVDPRVFIASKAYDPKDPKYKARIFQKPSIRLDDPDFVEKLRELSDRAMREKN